MGADLPSCFFCCCEAIATGEGLVRRAVDTTVEGQGFRRGLASSGGGIGVEVAQVQSWLAGQ